MRLAPVHCRCKIPQQNPTPVTMAARVVVGFADRPRSPNCHNHRHSYFGYFDFGDTYYSYG